MKEYDNIKIIDSPTPAQLDAVRDLIREFIKWHLSRHTEDIKLIKKYFDPSDIEKELAELPGKYSKPEGSLL